jgi:hypothetical protein
MSYLIKPEKVYILCYGDENRGRYFKISSNSETLHDNAKTVAYHIARCMYYNTHPDIIEDIVGYILDDDFTFYTHLK